jgi:hypothetical protein
MITIPVWCGEGLVNPYYFSFALDNRNIMIIKFSMHFQWPISRIWGYIKQRPTFHIEEGMFMQDGGYGYEYIARYLNQEEKDRVMEAFSLLPRKVSEIRKELKNAN